MVSAAGSVTGTAAPPVERRARLISDHDVFLFREGTHSRLYEKLGAHLVQTDRGRAVHFAVWAPNAEAVSVIGDFNDWDAARQARDT